MPDTRNCFLCEGGDDEGLVLLCDKCNVPFHASCVGFKGPVIRDEFCPPCSGTRNHRKRDRRPNDRADDPPSSIENCKP